MTAPPAAYDTARATARRAAMIEAALPAAGHAVEIGPGSGWLIGLLLERGWTVTAYEAAEEAAHRLADTYPDAEVVAERVPATRWAALAAGADAFFALSVLHHLEDPRTALCGVLEAAPGFLCLEVPARTEATRPEIIGGAYNAVLADLVANRRPSILGWNPSAYAPGHLRPLCVWDDRLAVGTVTAGNGWTSTEWAAVGSTVAAALDEPQLAAGSLNLELDRPLPDPSAYVRTLEGTVGALPVTVAGVDGWALTMPKSDRGPLFTEVVSPVRFRDPPTSLVDGDRVAVRF